ncbi:unnamed protein product [Owenia fusiformis]|uniref:Uncharacterized protein n=1 Tax=Owenia fusiformis TaxID=6347 RepID=A0A8J1Y0T7_OWEFU|nr:unnamed protein product [Owenia fusiformis]
MFSPLSLRLCCIAVMAPALTETATSHLKLQPSSSIVESPTEGDCHSPSTIASHRLNNKIALIGVKSRILQNRLTHINSESLSAIKFPPKLLTPGLQTRLASLSELFPPNTESKFIIQDFESAEERPKSQLIAIQSKMNNLTTNGRNGDSTTLVPETVKLVNKLKGQQMGLIPTDTSQLNKTNCTNNGVPGQASEQQTATSSAQPCSSRPLASSSISQSESSDSLLPTDTSSSSRTLPDTKVKDPEPVDTNVQMKKQQQHLDKRAERLAKRIRRLQSHQTITHVRTQLSGFVDNQHKNLECMAKAIKVPPSNNADLHSELLINEDIKNLSTAALVNLVRRLQSQQVTLRQRLTNTHTGNENKEVVKLDEETCAEASRVSSNLTERLRHLESELDSDATDESSGGESCDEDEFFDFEKRPTIPLQRRAEWKWAVDRAAIASRWTWLQAQVSDLEYRIRQQSDIYRQIRATKGSVVLGEYTPPDDLLQGKAKSNKKLSPLEAKIANLERQNELSPCNISTLLSNVDKQSTKLTQSLGNVYSPVQCSNRGRNQTPPAKPINGVIDPGSSQSNPTPSIDTTDSKTPAVNPPLITVGDASPCIDNTCQSARCRPVRSYRKRKLLRTAGLHQLNRKAARASTIKCQCYPPSTPCAMCGGRYNNKQAMDSDNMPLNERVGLLDPAFHPVLSFSQDVPLPVHFESLLKTGEWQNKPSPRTEKRKYSGADDHKKYMRKYNNKSPTTAAILNASTKLRIKYSERALSKSGGSLPGTPRLSASDSRICRSESKNRRKAARLAMAALTKKERRMSLNDRLRRTVGTPSPGPRETPPPGMAQSCPSGTLKEMKEALIKKRRMENAFDINNIVIPYGMAASSRVEKLQYKEIITPKWREVDPFHDALVTKTTENGPIKPEEVAQVNGTITSEEQSVKEAETGVETVAAAVQPGPVVTTPTPPSSPQEATEEIEDTSDEFYSMKHLPCEVQEKKRFISYLVTPTSRGRSANSRSEHRTDSRTRTDSGATTPDPLSPEASLNDSSIFASMNSTSSLQSVSSPLASPVTPNSSSSKLASLEEHSILGRKRSGSLSQKRERTISCMSDDNMVRSTSATPDVDVQVTPWETAKFPLSENDLVTYLETPPPPRAQPVITTSVLPIRHHTHYHHQTYDTTPVSSRACSPNFITSPESDEFFDDDPNDPEYDPEWTVVSGVRQPAKSTGLVLKLAKR